MYLRCNCPFKIDKLLKTKLHPKFSKILYLGGVDLNTFKKEARVILNKDGILRKFKNEDFREVSKLIILTFKKFNLKEGSKEAIKRYCDYYDSVRINKKFIGASYVFHLNNKIIGVIRARWPNRIVNLFVDGEYHKKGVGSKLLKRLEKEFKKKKAKIIKLNSSLYAVPFYQKNGYKKTTGIRNLHGIKVQPMKKILLS